MNIMELIQKGVDFIQTIALGVKPAQEIATVVGPVAIKALYLGRQLFSYLIVRKESTDKEPLSQIQVEDASAEALTKGMPSITKDDVALLVDINRRMFRDVSRYLETQKIDADMVILTNGQEYRDIKFLPVDDPAMWTELVQEFSAAMNNIKLAVGSRRVHIFLSTPLALAFGLGTVCGTVNNAIVYHWQDDTYHPEMLISRQLRSAPEK